MLDPSESRLAYKRSRFATRLPRHYRYLPSHVWIDDREGRFRVGLTKFAVRMLGDMVDHGLEPQPGAPVKPGQIIGWVEGFKAISDLYCVVDGTFEGGNPELARHIDLVSKSCYDNGWLYEVSGTPDSKAMSAEDYVVLLDQSIDRILEQEKSENSEIES